MRLDRFSDRDALISVAAAAIVAAISAIILIGPHRTDFSDSGDYIAAAKSLLQEGAYPVQGTLPFFRAPLYPMLLAAVWAISPGSVLAVKIVQAAFHMLTALAVFLTGKTLFGRRAVGFAGGMLAAFNPLMLYFVAAIQTEALHTMLVSVGIYFGIARVFARDGESFIDAIVAGIAFGLAALCRPSAFGIGFLIAFLIFGNAVWRKRNLALPLAMAAAIVLVVLPWTIRNYARFGDVILVNDAGGYALWVGNHPANLRFYDGSLTTAAEIGEYSDWIGKTLPAQIIAEWENDGGYSGLSPSEREARWRREAFANFRQYPEETLKLFGWKLLGFWKPYPSSEVFGPLVTAVAFFEIPVLLMAFLGLFLAKLRPASRNLALLFVIYFVAVTAIHVLLVATVRMRVPYVEPWTAMFAAFGAVGSWEAIFNRLDVMKPPKSSELK
ncbi:MAG: hypothetical protein C4324_00720 [Blastocatellia bacterium]